MKTPIIDAYFESRIAKLRRNCIIVLLISVALIFGLMSCRKEEKRFVHGGTYHVRTGIFASNDFQPLDTLYCAGIYYNPAANTQFCDCIGPGKNGKTDSLNNRLHWQIALEDLK